MSENSKFTAINLNLYYGDFHALKNINFEIEANKITALIGPSGCGKSTFLKTLNRMNDFVEGCKIEGDVLLDGKDIYKTDMSAIELRQRVGMVFQQLDEIVETSLREVGIWDEFKDRLHKSALGLSGGQQQRLCIARTVAVHPEVVLMDEPTSALDPISTMKIEDLAVEMKKKYTIVIVTHNMQQANRISDTTAFFLLGELIETGATKDLFLNPKNKKTEEYITGRFG